MADRFEININQSSAGWHWTLMREDGDRMVVVADSFEPTRTATAAAKEAEAEIAEPGRTLRRHRLREAGALA